MCAIPGRMPVGEGLDPPLHPRPLLEVFREGQDPPLRDEMKFESIRFFRLDIQGLAALLAADDLWRNEHEEGKELAGLAAVC